VKVTVKKQPICKHVHVTERTKTQGTPYIKSYCQVCKAWVYSEKSFCVCCRKRVAHKKHHIWLKRILSVAVQLHNDTIEEFRLFPYRELVYAEIPYNRKMYMIPIKYIALYAEHPHPNEIISLIQDATKLVK
jgi:hypothetical protein